MMGVGMVEPIDDFRDEHPCVNEPLMEFLSAEMIELPQGWKYDPGIVWDDIGIDLLIVDEAQNFAIDVLEQIRLLTNLETARQKLLQITLIGQPELRPFCSTFHYFQVQYRR